MGRYEEGTGLEIDRHTLKHTAREIRRLKYKDRKEYQWLNTDSKRKEHRNIQTRRQENTTRNIQTMRNRYREGDRECCKCFAAVAFLLIYFIYTHTNIRLFII